MTRLHTAAAAGCLAFALCTPAFADGHADLEAAVQGWANAFNSGDMDAMLANFHADASIHPPDAPTMTGHEAIGGFWQAVLDAGAHDLVLKLVDWELAGDTAIEVGTWQVNIANSDGGDDIVLGGKTLVVWTRGDDGTLRMAHDMWNDNPSE